MAVGRSLRSKEAWKVPSDVAKRLRTNSDVVASVADVVVVVVVVMVVVDGGGGVAGVFFCCWLAAEPLH